MAARRFARRSGRRLRTTGTVAWRRSGGTMTLRKRRRPSATGKGTKRRALPLRRRSYKRPKGRGTVSQATEYSRFTTRMGRYGRRTVKQAFKELRAGQSRVVYSHRNFYDFTRGLRYMSNKALGNGERICPLYLFDLTCCRARRTVDLAGTTYYDMDSQPMMQMKMKDNAVAWEIIDGSDANWLPTKNLQVETDTANAAGLMMGPNSLLKYYNIKLNLFGATEHVTKWSIQLMQLKDEELDPYADSTNFRVGAKYAGFWQSLVKPFMFNPIADQGTGYLKDMRVIKSWTFIQDAQQTTDKDVTPKLKEFRCFVKRNMLCKWDTAAIQPENNPTAVADQGGYMQNKNMQMNCYLPATRRTYLVIRAMNIGDDMTDGVQWTPSFDWNIKMCHVRINT